MQVLDLNRGIDFGRRGNLKQFSPVGFSPIPDVLSSWSESGVAELSFALAPLRHDLRLTIEVFPFLGDGQLPRQTCFVYVNGLFVHFQAVKTPLELVFTVSREFFNPRGSRLSFVLPEAASPKELGLGEDLRLLGLSFVKLSASEAVGAAQTAAAPPAARVVAPPSPAARPPAPSPAAPRDSAGPARPEAPPRPRRPEPPRGG